MNRQNAAAMRRIKQAFSVYLAEVSAAVRDLEHGNNVASCQFLDIQACIEKACMACHVTEEDIMGRKRDADTAWARHLAIYLAVKLTTHSEQRITQAFRRKRGTVSHSVAVVENRMATERLIKEQVEGLLK